MVVVVLYREGCVCHRAKTVSNNNPTTGPCCVDEIVRTNHPPPTITVCPTTTTNPRPTKENRSIIISLSFISKQSSLIIWRTTRAFFLHSLTVCNTIIALSLSVSRSLSLSVSHCTYRFCTHDAAAKQHPKWGIDD